MKEIIKCPRCGKSVDKNFMLHECVKTFKFMFSKIIKSDDPLDKHEPYLAYWQFNGGDQHLGYGCSGHKTRQEAEKFLRHTKRANNY